MSLGIPTLDGPVVALLDQQPRVLARSSAAARPTLRPHNREPAAQLVASQDHLELTFAQRPARVVGRLRLVSPPVPHDHIAAAVFALRDRALEVVVVQRVVLDTDGRPLELRVLTRALGDGPADEHAVNLQAEVVVEAPGPVPLHYESAPDGSPGRGRVDGLAGA
jgi:hypothetical protein